MNTCPKCFRKHNEGVVSCDCGQILENTPKLLQIKSPTFIDSFKTSKLRHSMLLVLSSFFFLACGMFFSKSGLLALSLVLILLFPLSLLRVYLDDPRVRIWKAASIARIEGVVISDSLVRCFCEFEKEKMKILSIKTQNKAILELKARITNKVQSIFKNFSRILIRESHLFTKLNEFESKENLDKRLCSTEEKIEKTSDDVSKGHLIRTKALLKQQMECIVDLTTFTERCETQRIQVIEECRSIFIKIGALEFADLKVSPAMAQDLEATLDSVDSEIQALEVATTRVLLGDALN
jgi:hypothetical protein